MDKYERIIKVSRFNIEYYFRRKKVDKKQICDIVLMILAINLLIL